MSTDQKRILLEIILSIIVILFTTVLILLIIFIRVKRPDLRGQNKINDISIISMESFDFIEDKTIPEYPYDNLGNTGQLILDCYTGTCINQIYHQDIWLKCDPDSPCETVDDSWTEHRAIIDHDCSEQCYKTGNIICRCGRPYDEIGICKNRTNDRYEKGKVCHAYNTIIDSNENQLCIRENLNCPINYISENKLNNDYNSVLIGNKTFYYGNVNTTKRKIIAGLVVDTDLYLNQDNEKKDIIDNYTISGVLEDNQNLYKNVNLGYDPYKEENVDSKGKSYLRIFYNEQNVNLSSLRENSEIIIFSHTLDNRALESIHYKTKVITILGLIALGLLLLVFIIILINQYSYYKRNWYGECGKGYYAFFIIVFIGLMITPLIFGCNNISKAKDAQNLIQNKKYSTFKNLNIAFIVIGFTLFLILIAYIILVPIKFGFKEKVNETINNTNKTISEKSSSEVNNNN